MLTLCQPCGAGQVIEESLHCSSALQGAADGDAKTASLQHLPRGVDPARHLGTREKAERMKNPAAFPRVAQPVPKRSAGSGPKRLLGDGPFRAGPRTAVAFAGSSRRVEAGVAGAAKLTDL